MPKGAKKRAKLKKQQQGHPDDGGNNTHPNGSDHSLRIPPKASHVDGSEDSMESSEEMVTPRAAGSDPDEEERKAAADVPVDALPPETGGQVRQGKDDAEVEVHAVVMQEPEVKDVVVDETPALQEPEVAVAPVVEVPGVKREVVKVHPVHELETKVHETAVVVGEIPVPPVVHELEVKGRNVLVKDSTQVSPSREVDVHTAQARGPAVAAPGHRATWWNCCGLFDAFSGSDR